MGIFDVSHMGRLYLTGTNTSGLMDWLVTNDAFNLKVGRARYALLCNENGGIIDDCIFYRLEDERYLLICNASNRGKVVSWIKQWIDERFTGIELEDKTESTGMIAIQGPSAASMLNSCLRDGSSDMRSFSWRTSDIEGTISFIGCTGYTGEEGFEIILPSTKSSPIWNLFCGKNAVPCGLGSRDVLRLEAGLPLHGNEIDENITPLEAGLDSFVRLDKDFIGADALRQQLKDGIPRRLVGLITEGKQIARHGYTILREGKNVGQVTSGTYSPTLDRNIALGYVPNQLATFGSIFQVNIRGSMIDAKVAEGPFYSRKQV